LRLEQQRAFAEMKGITPAIIAAGGAAYKVAYSQAFNTVFLTTIAFSALGIILAFGIPNVEKLTTNKIGATLHNRKGEVMEEEKSIV
jgi:uncharacterized membrane protein